MRLSQLFTGRSREDERLEDTGRAVQSRHSGTSDLNRQIRSLTPGQTLRGEIVSRNGSEVQIRLSEDMVMNARVDQSIHLELGKSVTFEVKSNGGTLSLSPLFTNIAADANVLKALDMAGLPINDISVSMTEQMMKAGLSVSRNSLQQVYREINSFPQGTVADVVNLHKLGMPVDETNMQQMASYRNLTHQLIKGMTSVLDALPQAAEEMLAEGNVEGTAGLYRELFSLIAEGSMFRKGGEEIADLPADKGAGAVVSQEPVEAGLLQKGQEIADGNMEAAGEGETPGEAGTPELSLNPEAAEERTVNARIQEQIPGSREQAAGEQAVSRLISPDLFTAEEGVSLPPAERAKLADGLMQALKGLALPAAETAELSEALQSFGRGELPAADLFQAAARMLEGAGHTGSAALQLHKLLGGKEFQKLLAMQLKEMWTLRPEEVSRPEKVEELYRRLDRQLKGLAQALESGGQENSTAYRAVANLSQNVDFMNQINQMYAYVQLPLQLKNAEAHGDLYVYTNKRSLAARDGQLSALLHLDMESLGPVDVYVTLQESKVSTKFYVADDEILDFIEEHLDILTKRLEKKGYTCKASASARGKTEKEEQSGGGLSPLLQQESGILLSRYAFDVRT